MMSNHHAPYDLGLTQMCIRDRSMPARELAKVAAEFCPKVIPAGSCREALAVASRAMGEDAALIVCGSFYLAGDIREMLLGKFRKE